MTPEEKDALQALLLTLNRAPAAGDIWHPSRFDVPDQHERVVSEILSGVNRACADDRQTPLAVAQLGRAGSGKTHLLGSVRGRIQQEGGYFFLVRHINGRTFWEATSLSIVEGFGQDALGWGTQHKTLMRRLTAQLGIDTVTRDAIAGDAPLTRAHLDTFIGALRRFNNEVGRDCQDTARALVLNGNPDFEAQDVGYAHLICEAGEPGSRAAWGLSSRICTPHEIVIQISRLIALTLSPTVIVFDQLDRFFERSTVSMFDQDKGLDEAEARRLGPMAEGLMSLRDDTERTLVVVSCLPDVWTLLSKSVPSTFLDRFREAPLPDRIRSTEVAKAIISKRFAVGFTGVALPQPYPTWPIAEVAFGQATLLTPRLLIRRVENHLRRCLATGQLTELTDLTADPAKSDQTPAVQEQQPTPAPPGEESAEFAALDRQFADLVGVADISGALDPHTEDQYMPALLSAGLGAWIDEQAPTTRTYKVEPQSGIKPAVHGRLIEILDEAMETEASWSLRAIASNHATAVISRLRAAHTSACIEADAAHRKLIVLRNATYWPNGVRVKEVTDAFTAAGGIVHTISEPDLKVFAALEQIRAQSGPLLSEWLASRKHASSTQIMCDIMGHTPASAAATGDSPPAEPTPALALPTGDTRTFQLGITMHDSSPFHVDLESLRRHTVIFAGSGSGKTVLIRRIVEECARQGVSAIVLDPNSDLARLGDAWRQPPTGWGPHDAAYARDYLDNTEVVIWTPRVSSGRPLAFQPLPDFRHLRETPDEFDQAVRSAVEALAPRAGVNGQTKIAKQSKAVLTEALLAYASAGNSGLDGFTDYLSNLPDRVSRMAKAAKMAHDLAETLKAAMITDPLFGGSGATADPGELLRPTPGKRARVSVISFIGLNSEEEKQSFVNQLQMALFAWVKRNPAGERPLGGLFVMDEAQTFAPSSGNTACTASSIFLASQARKYGLGLIFATQAPKGLHNQISGNATTQFFGLLNSPAQIDAAKDLARAKGGAVPDIGLLTRGQFYATGEGFSFTKVIAPMCLSHHPSSPLTPEEVLDRARQQHGA